MTAREWLMAVIVCIVLYPAALLALSGPRLFHRAFWADETLSWLIASDPSFRHGMAALAGGVDTNAPILHWTYHLAGNAFGHAPLTYRIVSAIVMSIGALGVYATLRRFTSRLPCAIGTFAMLALPIIVAHTTEARFYGFFLTAAVWTCFALDRRIARPTTWNAAGLAIASVVLCGVHYFGLLALGCIGFFGLFVLGRGKARRAIDSLWPSAAGVAMTLCLTPLLIAQRQALAGAGGTWVPDHFVQNLVTTTSMLLPTGSAMVIGLIIVVALIARRSTGAALPAVPTALWSLALLPVVMIAFDRVVQPVLVPRYLIPSLAAFAVLVCVCVAAMSKRLQLASFAALLVLFVGGALNMRNKIEHPDPRSGLGILAQMPADDLPIVVDWRGHLLPVWADRPSQRERLMFLDDPRISHPDLDQSIPFEREMVKIMNRFYGFPKTIGMTELNAMNRFRLVTEFPETAEARMGRVRVIERSPLSLVIERRSDAAVAE